jgi:hypothetical protein
VPLESLQRALARLYLDDGLRERFYAAPRETGASLDLTADEVASLLAADRGRLEFFADSLRFKRLEEAKRLLPRTLDALGDQNFRSRFLEFAREFVPSGVDKHPADAMAFAGRVASSATGPEVARFERSALGLFYRLDGTAAYPRRGPSVAFVRLDGRRALLWRSRDAARYRTLGARG